MPQLGEPSLESARVMSLKDGWWSSDAQGVKRITQARGGDTVFFHVITSGIPEGSAVFMTLYEDDKIIRTFEDGEDDTLALEMADPDRLGAKIPSVHEVVRGRRLRKRITLNNLDSHFGGELDHQLELYFRCLYGDERAVLPRSPSDYLIVIKPAPKLPIYIDRYKLPGKNEDGTAIANDMAYGYGIKISGQSVYGREEVVGVHSKMDLQVESSDSSCFFDFKFMARLLFARGELNGNIGRMIAKFERSEGGEYRDSVLTRRASRHPTTLAFCSKIEDEIAERLKVNGGDVEKMEDSKVRFRPSDYSEDDRYGRPHFSSARDLVEGLKIAINDVWSYEVTLTGYRQIGDLYAVCYKVILWDHFGLDMKDLTGDNWLKAEAAGFRAWFVLQHLKGYKPFIATIEFDRLFLGNLQAGKKEREAVRAAVAAEKAAQEEELLRELDHFMPMHPRFY